jgi:hypothetical protein
MVWYLLVHRYQYAEVAHVLVSKNRRYRSRGDKTARGEGMAKGSRKPPEPFHRFGFVLHNINNNNVIIIVFSFFDINMNLYSPESFDFIYPSMGHGNEE